MALRLERVLNRQRLNEEQGNQTLPSNLYSQMSRNRSNQKEYGNRELPLTVYSQMARNRSSKREYEDLQLQSTLCL